MFPSNLSIQLGFVDAKQDQSEGGSVSKSRLFLVLDLFASQCERNLIKKDRSFFILHRNVG